MKNAIILHGTSSAPNDFWFPWLKEQLEKKGYKVWVPQLPETDDPLLEIQLPFVMQNAEFSAETVIIGHSSGASLILAVLEALDIRIKQAILVAGFLYLPDAEPQKIVKPEKDYNWQKMKDNVQNIFFINSDDDPWGCNDVQGRKMFDKLGGTLIIRHGEGHMGSETFNQPYREFPLLLKLIE